MTLTHDSPAPGVGVAISDAVAATGLSAHTLRYDERAGLMLDPSSVPRRPTVATVTPTLRGCSS